MSKDHTISGSEKGQRLARATYPAYDRNKLPTLHEVLSRKTAPPVCLYNFYLYMRDREHASEYLDFYLDVLEHENICKAFVRDIKKLNLDLNIEYPEYERYRPAGVAPEKGQLGRYSVATSNDGGIQRQLSASSRESNITNSSGGVFDSPSRPESPYSGQHIIDIASANKAPRFRHRDSVRSNKTNTTTGNLSFYGRERPFTKDDLRESAERIYYKYIYQGSEKEIELSDHIREKITLAMEEDSGTLNKRADPWIFYEAKKEIFSFMEGEHFPKFLRARAFGNMNILQTMLRLVLGLFFLFIGFATALSLIFLDVKPRTVRIWNNNDQCDACGCGGRLMCCDSCPKAFHFTCLVPPLDVDNPPKGNWYCRECKSDKSSPSMPAQGPFQELIYKARCSNPKSYLLPEHVRNAFEDVGTGPHGEYVDTNRVKFEQKDRNGFTLEPDHHRMMDDNGKLIRCNLCRLPPSKLKPVMSCDFCELHWHFDCLSPPLVISVPANKKWMCPCHADHALPPLRRLCSESNLPFNDNTVIEYSPQKKMHIECDPEFYLNDTLHKLPKHGVKLNYIEQIMDSLQAEKEAEKNVHSEDIINDDVKGDDDICSDLHDGERLLSKKEGKQKVLMNDLHVDERPADRDVQQMVMEGSPTFQVINESGVTFDEPISPKRAREGDELKDSISFLISDNTNEESINQSRVKRTRQNEESKIKESSCINAIGGSETISAEFRPNNMLNQSHCTTQAVDMSSNSEKPNSESTFSDEIFEIEERLEKNEEVYKENPLRLLMEVALSFKMNTYSYLFHYDFSDEWNNRML
ncbi:1897_t:CDS:2 [Gigaspora margarita]|uniref:1897_t:CDS:1 n=1 Tax=Gigaspora margarita TaxID=4874 RepID=A0ABN7VC94_GIGMA|nr:1897_t:CDS:2 [Gigaspora margarita]